MPDVSPFTNALLWSLAIIFGCWAVVQLMEVIAALGAPGQRELPDDAPPLEEASAGHDRHH